MTTRALVLGGGGPIGVAWESGLVAGLEEHGVRLADADFFLGTSAGSIVGAQLAFGRPAAEMYASQEEKPDTTPSASVPIDMAALIAQFTKLFTSDKSEQERRAEMGAFALTAKTLSEEEWLEGFVALESIGGDGWPDRPYACTAIDTADGTLVAWDRDSGVPLKLAVASSCAVPGIFPPITINDRRYMDGGIGSTTNAQFAHGYDRVLVVVVANPDAGVATGNPLALERKRRFDEELGAIRSSGSQVEVIAPDEAFTTTFAYNLMDFTRRQQAATLGHAQGQQEAARITAFWR